MAVECINRITIKKDGVYISSKSSNCSEPYRSSKIDSLTEIYNEGGREALDKELIYMFHNYCRPMGTHPSILPFRYLPYYLPYKIARAEMIDKINYAWDHLSKEDRETRWKEKKTEGMKNYFKQEEKFLKEFLNEVYDLYVRVKKREKEESDD